MKCPRCDNDIPEDLKFCGLCGIEVESGKEITLDAWNSYFNFVLMEFSEVVARKSRLMLLIVVLVSSTIVIWAGCLPFQTTQTLLLYFIAPFIVLFFGNFFLFGLKDEIKAIGKHLGGFEDARLAILTGKLTTSKEIVAHLENLIKGLNPRFKDVRSVARRILDELPQ